MVRFVGLAVLVWIPPAAFVLARVARVRRAGYDRDALVGWLVYSWYFPPESHTIPVPWRHRLGWAFLWPAAALIVLERLLVPVPGIDHAAVLYMTIPAVLLALVTSALGLRSGRLTDVALMAQARYWNYGKFPPLLFALVQRFGGPPQRSTLPAV
jgi:hypothetical protein